MRIDGRPSPRFVYQNHPTSAARGGRPRHRSAARLPWDSSSQGFEHLIFELIGRTEELLDLLTNGLGKSRTSLWLSPDANRAERQSGDRCGYSSSPSGSARLQHADHLA